jgi:hypothetical protein
MGLVGTAFVLHQMSWRPLIVGLAGTVEMAKERRPWIVGFSHPDNGLAKSEK